MPDFLAIDWDHDHLACLEANAGRGDVKVRRAFVLAWPENARPADDPAAAGRWLREQISARKVSARQVLVSLPREDVVTRRLQVPDVPDADLPELVRMQAATKITTPLDQLHLDFLPLPKRPDVEGREVLMTTLTRKRSTAIRETLEAADLEVSGMGVSAIATGELAARTESQRGVSGGEASLVVARHGDRVEITILREKHVSLTHSSHLHEDDDDDLSPRAAHMALLAEVNRSMIAIQSQLHGLAISQVWLIGSRGENEGLVEALEKRFKCPVGTIDPLEDGGVSTKTADVPQGHGTFAGPAGLLLGHDQGVVPAINFLSPRKAAAKRDPKRTRNIAIAAIAAVLAIAAIGYRWQRSSNLREEIETTRNNANDIKNMVKAGQPVVQAAGLVEEWTSTAPHSVQLLADVNRNLPGTELVYLTNLELRGGNKTVRSQVIATARAKGEADKRNALGQFADNGFKVKAAPSAESKDSAYPVKFGLDIDQPIAK